MSIIGITPRERVWQIIHELHDLSDDLESAELEKLASKLLSAVCDFEVAVGFPDVRRQPPVWWGRA